MEFSKANEIELSEMLTQEERKQMVMKAENIEVELGELFKARGIHAAFCAWTDASFRGEDENTENKVGSMGAVVFGCGGCGPIALALAVSRLPQSSLEIYTAALGAFVGDGNSQ